MHLVIISGATRPQSKSNTAKVIAAFQKGFEENGSTRKSGIFPTAGNGSRRQMPLNRISAF